MRICMFCLKESIFAPKENMCCPKENFFAPKKICFAPVLFSKTDVQFLFASWHCVIMDLRFPSGDWRTNIVGPTLLDQHCWLDQPTPNNFFFLLVTALHIQYSRAALTWYRKAIIKNMTRLSIKRRLRWTTSNWPNCQTRRSRRSVSWF